MVKEFKTATLRVLTPNTRPPESGRCVIALVTYEAHPVWGVENLLEALVKCSDFSDNCSLNQNLLSRGLGLSPVSVTVLLTRHIWGALPTCFLSAEGIARTTSTV